MKQKLQHLRREIQKILKADDYTAAEYHDALEWVTDVLEELIQEVNE